MTKKQKLEYLKNSHMCPWCKSKNIDGSSFDIEGGEVTQNVSCTECGKEWVDTYKLVDVNEVVR